MTTNDTFARMRKEGKSKSSTMVALYKELGEVGKVRDVFVDNGVMVSYNFVYNVISKAGLIKKQKKTW